MGFLSPVQRILGFTQNELRALLFLTATFFLGLGVRWFHATGQSGPDTQYDYSKLDSIFSERSGKVLPDSAARETKQKGKHRAQKRPKSGSININTASKDELMLLPGIGETYAERILIYRQDHGPFRSIDDLSRVKGIGKKTLARIREFIQPVDSASSKR